MVEKCGDLEGWGGTGAGSAAAYGAGPDVIKGIRTQPRDGDGAGNRGIVVTSDEA